jgi:hypothetical protein
MTSVAIEVERPATDVLPHATDPTKFLVDVPWSADASTDAQPLPGCVQLPEWRMTRNET